MVQNPPRGYPRISPYLYYEDVGAALQWLADAFGFTERMRMNGPDGAISHAEMDLDGGVIMLGHPSDSYESPARHGHSHHLVHVYVDDVDGHFARAEAAGAKIVARVETKPYGDRNYIAEDPEGQQWTFAQHVEDVDLQGQA
jgi:PhnB protein